MRVQTVVKAGKLFVVVMAIGLGAIVALARMGQDGKTRAGVELGDSPKVTANISDAAFITGDWSEVKDGRFSQEVWTKAQRGTMLGMFRMAKADGVPFIYELMTILEKDGSLELRITHFDKSLKAVEKLKDIIVLDAVEKEEGRLVFGVRENPQGLSRVAYSGTGNGLRIALEYSVENGKARPMSVFEFEKGK